MQRKGAVAVLVSVTSIKRCAASLVPLKLVGTSNDAFEDQVDDLTDIEHYAKSWSSNHEVGEDSFLCGSSNVTVHNIRTWHNLTLHQPWQVETVINIMEDVQEGFRCQSWQKGWSGTSTTVHRVSSPCFHIAWSYRRASHGTCVRVHRGTLRALPP